MEIGYQYVKLRKQFGRQPRFTDTEPQLLVDLRPNEEHALKWAPLEVATSAVQAAKDYSQHEVATVAVVRVNAGMNHVEGGWPKEVDPTEAEQVIRYRKKVEKDEDYVRCISKLGSVVEGLVLQNNALDIYERYFADLPDSLYAADPPSASTLTVLRGGSAGRGGSVRGVQAVSWDPDGSARLAAALAGADPGSDAGGSGFLWDLSDPGRPELELAAPSALCALAHALKDRSLLGGGLANGQLALFDVRRGGAPVERSAVEASHRGAVADMAWTQSKAGAEVMTAGPGGEVLWWDVRQLAEPLERLAVRERSSEAPRLGALCLEYSPSSGPSRFMVGTQQGPILAGNRKAKTPADRITASYTGHHGPAVRVQRSPFFPKFFLSVGDWAARLWSEDLRSPAATTPYCAPALQLTAGGWSPTRPGLFYTADSGGALHFWDLCGDRAAPGLTVRPAEAALQAVAYQAGQAPRLLAAGCAAGTISVLRLSDALVEPQGSEKASASAALEREANREKNLEKSAKEAKAKARREAQRLGEPADTLTDEDLAQLERDFLKAMEA